jgi:hypothetical protein
MAQLLHLPPQRGHGGGRGVVARVLAVRQARRRHVPRAQRVELEGLRRHAARQAAEGRAGAARFGVGRAHAAAARVERRFALGEQRLFPAARLGGHVHRCAVA